MAIMKPQIIQLFSRYGLSEVFKVYGFMFVFTAIFTKENNYYENSVCFPG